MTPGRDLWMAIGFLTRIPVGDPSGGDPAAVSVARSVPWFPIVGAVIGAAVGAVWLGLFEVVSPIVAAAVSVAVALLVTGAFHHDGLADIADAFGGGWTVEQRFEILRDSRLGTYGTSALVMALLIEVTALASLPGDAGFWALIAAHSLGRTMALLAMLLAPTAGDGMGASYTADLGTPSVVFGASVGLLCAGSALAMVDRWAAIVLPAIAAALAAVAVVVLAQRKIGGITGDVLGAVTVLSSLATLVVVGATI